jgi:hypothetical protein
MNDTSAEAERVLVEVHRRMPLGQKWLLLGQLYRDARLLHAAGVRLRNPHATSRDVREAWLRVNLGFTAAGPTGEDNMEQQPSGLAGLREVIGVLDRLGIAYSLGGSMASSIHGINRQTNDADLTVEPFPGKEPELAAAFGPDYYVSLAAVQEAVRHRTSFNVINTRTGFKADLFIHQDQPFERSAFARRLTVQLPDVPDQPLCLHTPEDIILFKLRWYRLGNETSEQQWRDVLGVLRVQGTRIDPNYLDEWAPALGVSDLLARARGESQL